MACVKVCMIGPRGCGKTSILGVMLNDIQQFVKRLKDKNKLIFDDKDFEPSLSANTLTYDALTDPKGGVFHSLGNLVSAAIASKGASFEDDVPILATDLPKIYGIIFGMGRFNTEIEFCDFPGGFYSDKFIKKGIFTAQQKNWEQDIRESQVLLIVIDAATQLGTTDYLQDRSYYDRISTLVEQSVRHSHTTVIFVPVKCEHLALKSEYDYELDTIVQNFDKNGCDLLQAKVCKKFSKIMALADDDETQNNFEALFMPMITVGGIKFVGTKLNPSATVKLSFGPVIPDHYLRTPFAPRNCDKIFAMCLIKVYQNLVDVWKAESSFWEKIKAKVLKIFKNETPFERFFRELARSLSLPQMFYNKEISIAKDANDEESLKLYSDKLAKLADAPFDGCVCLTHCTFPTNL